MVNPPPLHLPYLAGESKVETVDRSLTAREQTIHILKSNLVKAQHRMKQQADSHRTEREFQVGDWVYLKLQPYRQSSVTARSNYKLSAKFYGPYLITAKVGKVAYTLKLPDNSSINPTFHVSLLKKHHGPIALPGVLPAYQSPSDLPPIPKAVLKVRQVKRQNATKVEWLVQWEHKEVNDATWEDAALLMETYPFFDPWGQGSS